MAGGKLDVLALACSRNVVDGVGFQAGVGEHALVAFLRQLHWVAPPDALAAFGKPFLLAAVRSEQCGLDRARADIDADGADHDRASAVFPSSTTARQANVAPPRAPV